MMVDNTLVGTFFHNDLCNHLHTFQTKIYFAQLKPLTNHLCLIS